MGLQTKSTVDNISRFCGFPVSHLFTRPNLGSIRIRQPNVCFFIRAVQPHTRERCRWCSKIKVNKRVDPHLSRGSPGPSFSLQAKSHLLSWKPHRPAVQLLPQSRQERDTDHQFSLSRHGADSLSEARRVEVLSTPPSILSPTTSSHPQRHPNHLRDFG